MSRMATLTALLLLTAVPAWAQPKPFDMTPESNLRVAPPPVHAPAPAADAPQLQPQVPQRFERPLLPSSALRLTGEESRAAFVVYLTETQATAPAQLQLSYLNAVVVAPEYSNLAVTINGTEISRTPIASSANATSIVADVPAGLLRAGANTIEFFARQRHRTDCTIDSTFELWTEISSASAILSFEGVDTGRITKLADLAAIGVDNAGNATIRLVDPVLDQGEASRITVKLMQQLALALRVPNIRIEDASALSEQRSPGVLDLVVGVADQLPPALGNFRAQAASGPIAALVPQASGAYTLLVSGPDWPSVAQASDAILAAAPTGADHPRIDLPSAIPIMLGGESIPLADLGVSTTEFNGRRYTAQFQFELPFDFYANRYGQAELVLDAAYSADVQPGSEINIYTNDQIASATPLLRTDGGTLRDTVIRVPMTNLRPGRNELDLVVNLQTQSDTVCGPGWTGRAPLRFVFSSGSQFRLPAYARAASLPDMQVLTGSAWPYADDAEVPLVLGSGSDVAVSAMTMLARLAASSGKVLPVTIISEAQLRPDQNALLVMPLSMMAPPTVSRVGVSGGAAARVPGDDSAALNQFQSNSSDNFFTDAGERVLQGLGLTIEDLRFLPRQDAAYPINAGTVVLAQSLQPEGGLWTVLTGPDGATMQSGIQRMAVTEQWRQVGGRVSTLGPAGGEITVVQALAPKLVQTQPLSFMNLRLIAANWFSGNILAFTAALALAGVLLMLATALMLGKVGRPK